MLCTVGFIIGYRNDDSKWFRTLHKKRQIIITKLASRPHYKFLVPKSTGHNWNENTTLLSKYVTRPHRLKTCYGSETMFKSVQWIFYARISENSCHKHPEIWLAISKKKTTIILSVLKKHAWPLAIFVLKFKMFANTEKINKCVDYYTNYWYTVFVKPSQRRILSYITAQIKHILTQEKEDYEKYHANMKNECLVLLYLWNIEKVRT